MSCETVLDECIFLFLSGQLVRDARAVALNDFRMRTGGGGSSYIVLVPAFPFGKARFVGFEFLAPLALDRVELFDRFRPCAFF